MHTIDWPKLVCIGVREYQPTTHTHTSTCPTFPFWKETDAYGEARALALIIGCIPPCNVVISVFVVVAASHHSIPGKAAPHT